MSGTTLPGEVAAYWESALSSMIRFTVSQDVAFSDVLRRYREPHRHYHTLQHVRDLLAVLQLGFEVEVADAPALYLAAILHDAIYDTRAKDNEERSAEYAHELLASLGVRREVREEVARLILLTRTHETTEVDTDGIALLDADLAILCANESAYATYAAAIRREYDWVSEEDYRRGRRAVLEPFLARPHIYFTPIMRERCEAARANLAREIESLR